jgi:hypothetical protein
VSDGASTVLSEPEAESPANIERAARDVFARAAVLTVHLALSGLSQAGRAFSMGVSDAMTSYPSVEYVENATAAVARSQELASEIEKLFRQWHELRFEDGMENDLSRMLRRLLMAHPTLLMEALAAVIVTEKSSPRVAAEVLRHLGRFVHPPSQRDRLWLLGRALKLSSPMSRDGASLGLAHLNDPAAIPYLQKAIDAEPVESLKEDLRQILNGLQNASDATAG